MPDDQGLGVTSLLDYIRDKNEDSYRSIQNDIVDLFPNVARFQLDSRGKGKTFEVVLKDGATVQAGATSEGLRYYVAFAALRHALPRALMLVEEPENRLHPSRVADVVKVLRATSEHMQVIIATHSPLVINEMQPEEVTLVTRDPLQGTQTRPMTETAHFADRLRIYALGELWLSYADGKTEHGLVSDPVAAE